MATPDTNSRHSPRASHKAPLRAERQYERSGLYPEGQKAFRIWALLAWLAGIIAGLAGLSALLNYIFLG